MSKLLIVESPSKAKTLNKYLGKDFEVLASYGHVRDLIPKNGAVDTEHDFAMKYDLIARNSKHVDAIAKAVKKADSIYLATDPDREGEAISWHIAEILQAKNLLKDKVLKRVVFHEITKNAVEHAIAEPRDISMPMVNAQQARRALDYLVGFNLSPLLWKKIRRGLSAGRVQSPALRLIVERELEIEAFQSQEYWSIHLDAIKANKGFTTKLVQLNHEKVEQFTVINHDQQADIVGKLLLASAGKATVSRVEKKQRKRSPAAPFTTSTLQQEAVRKLGYTTSRAMRIAQQLYEGVDVGSGTVGLITYMRTDSFSIAVEAVSQIREYIKGHFEPQYLPKVAIAYKTKSKSAQEAHEAIRPTDITRTPASVRQYLNDEQFKLYEMIWKRTLACQMASAIFDAVSADLSVGSEANLFRASGQTLVFPGFIAVYMEGKDDEEDEESDSKLPPLETGEILTVEKIYGDQHFTEPPPRYGEASLVKILEEYGIGRPSTYASIISTLQDREYVVLDKKRFTPTDVGRVVNKFLTQHFTKYVDYDFTANLESALDSIAEGEREWIPVMDDFWSGFNQQLISKADVERPGNELIEENCPKCGKQLQKQLSRYGSFIGCTGYNDEPKCDYKRNVDGAVNTDPVLIGKHEETGQDILLMSGPYGPYLQLGLPVEGEKKKPKRVSVPPEFSIAEMNMESATTILSLPRDLGLHPETGKKIVANIGRFGPYVNHNAKFKSIPKTMSVFEIAHDEAVALLAMASGPVPIKSLGNHPSEDGMVEVFEGRYGPYVQHAKVRATLPKSMEIDAITMDEALALLNEKIAKTPAKKATTKKASTKKAPTTKTSPKKPAAKKTVKSPRAKKASTTSVNE